MSSRKTNISIKINANKDAYIEALEAKLAQLEQEASSAFSFAAPAQFAFAA